MQELVGREITNVVNIPLHTTLVRDESKNCAQESGLASTIGTENNESLTFFYIEGEMLKNRLPTESDGEIVD
jgi:hypothetical protein